MDQTIRTLNLVLKSEKKLFAGCEGELDRDEKLAWQKEIEAVEITLRLLIELEAREEAFEKLDRKVG